MDQYSLKDFIKLLKKNSQLLRHAMLEEGTDCMRVYDRHQDDFPFTVDLYSNYVRVVDYGEERADEQTVKTVCDTVARMLYVPEENVIYSYRAKRSGKEQHEREDRSVRTVVHEGNLEFEVELASYADAGLFLDHYLTRQMIKEASEGKDVLNLFSYTGSFSVYAASGLAKSVTSVDLSSTYTKWAEENLKRNGYSGSNYTCVCCDAAKYIDKCLEEGKKYDIIIFDPPSFSNSHKMDEDFDVGRDAFKWIKKLSQMLRKDGFIMFSTNLGSFNMDRRRLKGLSVREITGPVMAPGFAKNRKGAVRSWIMTLDDNSLNLDWSEDKPVKKETIKKEYGKNEYKPERRYSSDRRSYGDRRQSSGRRDGYHRDFHRDDNRGERRSSYSSRNEHSERYERSDRYERNDRPRYSDSYADRPRRSYPDSSENRYQRRDGYHRDFQRDDSRSDRPRRNYSDRREDSRSFSHDDRPRRREYNSERPKYAKTENRRPSGPKPYGYDSFKPARSRNDDDPDLFWN